MKSPLKYHGGKHYLAGRLAALLPPHRHYVEPYAGGLSVLLARDPEGVSEVANDLDGDLANFWRCLGCPGSFQALQRLLQALPFGQFAWDLAREHLARGCPDPQGPCVGCAAAFFVHCRQSLAGRRAQFAPLSRRRTRRGMNEQASAWLSAVEGLPLVHERLKRVVVLNRPALEVLHAQDGPDTCFYLDPPYVPETRAATGEYAREMSREDHEQLLEALAGLEGKVLLSGYPCPLYDDWALEYGWQARDFDLANHAAGGDSKRRMTERVWLNFAPGGLA